MTIPRRMWSAALLVVVFAAAPLFSSTVAHAANAVQTENLNAGTDAWQIPEPTACDGGLSIAACQASPPNTLLAERREIEGYASATSVPLGGQISFMVSTRTTISYYMQIYRLGWYGGLGGRLLTPPGASSPTIGPLAGIQQPTPVIGPAPDYLIEANWPVAYTLNVPPTWTSGYFVVKLIRADGYERYIPFTVRNDASSATFLMQASVTTWQAYNWWGGKNLYGSFNVNVASPNYGLDVPGPGAGVVSFDRPYANSDYTGWELEMMRYLERNGRDVTYATDVDTHSNPNLLLAPQHAAFLSVGHDEYWSAEMRANVIRARDQGVHLAFFGANAAYFRIKFAADGAGSTNRRIICYKNPAVDPLTIRWRDQALPENAFIGEMSDGAADSNNYIVTDASSWIFAGAGLHNGSVINGLVGYEYDRTWANSAAPAGLHVVAHSPTLDGSYSESSLYTAPSGAVVFAAGTIQWASGLDDFRDPWANAGIGVAVSVPLQKTTANILDRLSVPPPPPPPLPTVTGISPASGPASGGTVVTIGGTNFSTTVGATTVSFGGNAGTAVSCASTTTCSATSPAGSGTVDVTVTVSGQTSVANPPADQFTYPGPPVPTVTGITPTTGPASGGTPVTISGTNFSTTAGATTVAFGGTSASAVSCSSTTTCSANSPPGSGSVDVRVTVSGQTSPAGSADVFTYAPGAGVLFSDGFESGTLAAWDGTLGPGGISVVAAAAHTGSFGARFANTASGQYGVLLKQLSTPLNDSYTRFFVRFTGTAGLVTVAYGRDASSSVNRWILYYDPAHQTFDYYLFNGSGGNSVITPTNGVAPLGSWVSVELRYNGSTAGGGQIWINGISQPGWSVSGDFSNTAPYQRLQLWNDVVATTDFDDVTVGTSQTAAPPPAVTALSPNSGPSGGGTIVAISGTNFSTTAGATTVSFGGAAGTAVSCSSTTSCVATSPSGVGPVDVTVTVNGQTSATGPADQYTYPPPPPPTVSAIDPTSGPAAGGTTVTITGTGFSTAVGATTVHLGTATQTAVCNTTTTCTVPSSAGTGVIDVTVTVGGQTSATSAADQFSYTPGQVFNGTFGSGKLQEWDGTLGSGSVTVSAAAAHTSSFGVRLADSASGQYAVLFKQLPISLDDSFTRFAVRFNGTSGLTTVAFGRDVSSSQNRWILFYDPAAQGFDYFIFNGSGASTEIMTANGVAPLGAWSVIELRYTGTATGGGQIWVNGISQPSWSVSGNFATSAPYQRLQLWNDALGATDFDTVTVSTLQTASPIPTVTGISPTSGPAAGGTVVGITGTNFSTTAGATAVSFGGVAGTAVSCASTTSCSATSPAGAGSVDVTATVGGQTSATSAADRFTYPPPAAPTLTGISPTSGQGAGGTVVTINGTNFSTTAGATTVAFGAAAATGVSCASTTTCSATSPAGSGTVDVTVTVAGQTSATSAADQFSYAGAVFSDGFESGTLAAWDGAQGPGSTTVVAAAARTGNFGLRLADSAAGQYALVIKRLPASLADSYTRFNVRFTGTTAATTVAYGRDDSSSVHRWVLYYDPVSQSFSYYIFNGSGASTGITTSNGSAPLNTWLTVELHYNGSATGGGQIWVNGISQPSWSVSGNYANTAPYQRVQLWNDAIGTTDFDDVSVGTSQTAPLAPSVSGISPTSGPATGGTVVTISGSNFSTAVGTTAVNFGTAAGTAVSCASTTSCTATSPAGAGPVDVQVMVGGQTSVTSAADRFTYPPPPGPAVTGISPVNGPAAGGTVVSITGMNFNTTAGATTVRFGTAAATSVSCTSTATCSATSPAGTGLVDVTVTTGGQTSATTAGDLFSYTAGAVFSDGFESGTLAAWDSALGSGSITVTAAAARTGSFGARLANSAAGQYTLLVKRLPTSLDDSYTRFNVRFTGSAGLTTVAYGRDDSSSTNRWILYYDPASQSFSYYLFNASGSSTAISTGNGSAPLANWLTVELHYNGTASGGGQIWVNNATQPSWSVSGNFATNGAPYQRLQLWNEAVGTTDFDDVSVGTSQTAPPPPTVTGISPTNGPASGSTAVTITGTSFSTTAGATTVSFGGVAGTSVSCASTTSCSATSPPGSGTVDVTATVGGQTSATSTVDQFIYGPPPAPTVSGINPTSGAAAGGTVVTITGTNFSTAAGATTVAFGGAAGSAVSCASSTSCTATSPAGIGTVDITVTVGGQTTATSAADLFSYTPGAVFSDSFESGTLSAWDGAQGPGSTTVLAAAARTGSFGVRLTNSAGQYAVLVKRLPISLADSYTRFSVRFTGTAGVTTVAYGRDDTSSVNRWVLYYDPGSQSFSYSLFNSAGASTSITTANGSAPLATWLTVELRYNGTTSGGGQIWINDVSQPTWSASGDFSNAAPFRRLQLWNEAAGTTDFDDVSVSTIQAAPPPPPQPTVTGISPTGGPAAGGTAITITGTDFSTTAGATTVAFGGTAGTAVSCASTTSCSATSPAGSGSVDVRVTVGGQTSAASGADLFAYAAAPTPTVTGINPTGGPAAGGTVVTITGTNFSTSSGATTVAFGGAAGTTVSCASSTSCGATSPAGSGTVDVRVTVGGQASATSAADLFAYAAAPGPAVSGISPTGGPAGGGTVVTITGSNFSTTPGATTVAFGSGSGSAVSCASATTCSATSPPGGGTVDVTVTVAGQTSATSAADQFSYAAGVVFSDGFESGTLAAWDGAQGPGSTTVVAAAGHTGSFGARLTNTTGQYAVLVKRLGTSLTDSYTRFAVRFSGTTGVTTVAYGRDDTSSVNRWTLYYDPASQSFSYSLFNSGGVSTSITTANGSAPLGTWLTVEVHYNGTATGGGQIWINDVSQPAWSVSGNFASTAPFQRVQLWNDAVGTTDFDDVTVSTSQTAPPPAPQPTVTGISPTGGPAAGGTVVTITGTNFSTTAGATTVAFGAAAGTSVSCLSTTSCSATSPAGSGSVDVRATVGGQTSATSAADLFAYGAAPGPAVSGISPTSGPAAGGTAVTVTGSNFSTTSGATTVSFGGIAGTAVSCASTTSCSATSPAGNGTVDVTATVAGQTSATGPADQFSYIAPAGPTVSGISPTTGPSAGGTVVTITGTNFSTAAGATTVAFGPSAGTAVTCASTTSCTATSPVGTGSVDVRVTVGAQTSAASAADLFSYAAGAIFSDNFESGTLAAWDTAQGTGSTTVVAAAARTGSFGLRLANSAAGQYAVLIKRLGTSVTDSYTRFSVRFTGSAGVTTVAYGRDDSSSVARWILYYDPGTQSFTYALFNSAGVSTSIATGNGSAPLATWLTVELRYNGTVTGGGQIWINDASQPAWSVSGDFSNSAPYRRLQLWNEVVGTVDIDDLTVSTLQTAP